MTNIKRPRAELRAQRPPAVMEQVLYALSYLVSSTSHHMGLVPLHSHLVAAVRRTGRERDFPQHLTQTHRRGKRVVVQWAEMH